MRSNPKPPKFAIRLLNYFSSRFRLPEIQGDLEELFYKRSVQQRKSASFRFWFEALRAIPSMWFTYQRRNKSTTSLNPFFMLFKNLIVGIRHILKRPVYSFTTIAGLSLGAITCFIIFHYIRFERSFDQYHEKIDDLAVVLYNVKMDGIESNNSSAPHFIGPIIQNGFPEVLAQCRVMPVFGTRVVSNTEKMFEEDGIAYADSTFLQLFSYPLLEGNSSDQLKRPATIILTESMAKKYFGSNDVIGKTMTISNKFEYEVTGVLADIPLNSHFRFDMLISMSTRNLPIVNAPADKDWNSPNYLTYLLLAKNTNIRSLEAKINNAWLDKSETLKLEIQYLTDLHFNASIVNDDINITDEKYLNIFTAVAVLVLLMACINYVNLVTARANERGREVGIRKISGATAYQLFGQFMTDSFLHILPAIAIALFAFFLVLPVTSDLFGIKLLSFTKDDYVFTLKTAGSILFAVTIFAGLYPSVIMTKFKPVSILKGKFQNSQTAVTLRKGLVIFQFCISMALIICATVISGQLNYMQNKSLGFDKEHTLILPLDAALSKTFDAFKTETEKLNAVTDVVPVLTSPTNIVTGYGAKIRENSDYTLVGALSTNADFVKALNIKILAGKNFEIGRSDSIADQFLVNETFLTKFGFTEEDVLGKKIILGIVGEGEIIGVVNDFHTGSLHQKIEPVIIFNHKDWMSKILIKLTPGNVQQQLTEVETVWKKFAPHRPFAYSFMDENYNNLYQKEMQINRLTHVFSGLSIIIACLGILGLASYNAAQRAKEIGIRKVLGASTPGILVLMTKDFLLLISISFVLAIPLAYYFSNDWLQYFEYRISLTPLHFILAGAIVFAFAILTITYQTLKASQMNPAQTLKAE